MRKVNRKCKNVPEHNKGEFRDGGRKEKNKYLQQKLKEGE